LPFVYCYYIQFCLRGYETKYYVSAILGENQVTIKSKIF